MAAEPLPNPSSEPEFDWQTVTPLSSSGVNLYYFQARLDLNLQTIINNYDYLTFPSIRQQALNHLLLPDSPLIAILARWQGQVVGMALAQLQAESQMASLRSLCVLSEHRRQGVGGGLLKYLEEVLARQSYQRLEFIYQTDWSNHPVVAPVLERRGWVVRPHQLLLKMTREQLAQAPALDKYHLPQAFTAFPWSELNPEEWRAIQQRQAQTLWYPPEQDPFQYEPFIEPQSSLGLRHQGQVVGWKIHHHFTPDTVRKTLLFLSPEYRGQGVGVALLVESLRRYLNTQIPFYIGEVEAGNSKSVAWWQTHFVPYMAELIETHRAEKALYSTDPMSLGPD